MKTPFTEEMVQVAAVSVSILEDQLDMEMEDVFTLVRLERFRQMRLWGNQMHPPSIWMAILMEEVGEVADEIRWPGSIALKLLLRAMVKLGRKCEKWLESHFGPTGGPTP